MYTKSECASKQMFWTPWVKAKQFIVYREIKPFVVRITRGRKTHDVAKFLLLILLLCGVPLCLREETGQELIHSASYI